MCGFAPSLTTLIICRVLQGLGGGALQPVSQAILRETFPREKQGMAMAVYGMGVVFAPVVGPTLGGWITDNYTWRWIFLINIPVGICSLLLTSLLIFDPPYLFRKNAARRIEALTISVSVCSPPDSARSRSCSMKASATTGSLRTPSWQQPVIAVVGVDRRTLLGVAPEESRWSISTCSRNATSRSPP